MPSSRYWRCFLSEPERLPWLWAFLGETRGALHLWSLQRIRWPLCSLSDLWGHPAGRGLCVGTHPRGSKGTTFMDHLLYPKP